MDNNLDRMLQRLGEAPSGRALDALADDVGASIAARERAQGQAWRIRGTAALFIAAVGVVVSASTAALPTPQPPLVFAVWSPLAPSTLLEAGR